VDDVRLAVQLGGARRAVDLLDLAGERVPEPAPAPGVGQEQLLAVGAEEVPAEVVARLPLDGLADGLAGGRVVQAQARLYFYSRDRFTLHLQDVLGVGAGEEVPLGQVVGEDGAGRLRRVLPAPPGCGRGEE